jgi:hypothetical protein
MRVLVCGGRDFDNEAWIYDALNKVYAKYGDNLEIITGACPEGADNIAEKWAKEMQVDYRGLPAKWTKQGRSAGPIRNKRMRDTTQPDACIAFPGGNGTKGMIALMREIGIEPWLVGWSE